MTWTSNIILHASTIIILINHLGCFKIFPYQRETYDLNDIGLAPVVPNGMSPLFPIEKPSLYSIEARYECTGGVIAKINRYKFMQSINKRCNEVSGEVHNISLNVTFESRKQTMLKVFATQFIDDYRGMRIMALDGYIDPESDFCAGDRVILLEVELPKLGNCEIGIFQHESLLAFARIKGKCDAFCPGKVAINYITPLGNSR